MGFVLAYIRFASFTVSSCHFCFACAYFCLTLLPLSTNSRFHVPNLRHDVASMSLPNINVKFRLYIFFWFDLIASTWWVVRLTARPSERRITKNKRFLPEAHDAEADSESECEVTRRANYQH